MTRLQNNPGNDKQGQIVSPRYDIIIIGAGVVGCAMARKLTLEGASVIVIEKASDILDGASKGNSAILHTGFDAPPGSLEQACIADSYDEYMKIHSRLGLPVLKTGALVVAWNDDEENQLEAILQQAHLNGIKDAELMSAAKVLQLEPQLSDQLRAAVHVPREFVIDPWTTPYIYMLQAVKNGAVLRCSSEVTGGEFDGDNWLLHTRSGDIKGSTVINCSGLYGDKLDSLLINKTAFNIRPRKGQFIVYDKSANRLLNSIILPVPNDITKGVVVCRTIFGNLLVGPTAEEQNSRSNASVTGEELAGLRRKGEEILPALVQQPVTATYAGIRPATEYKDYCIQDYPDQQYICVGGIRSTGLTAALGIASLVYKKYIQKSFRSKPAKSIVCPTLKTLAETEARDWQIAGNGGIVCHCELVTEREIKQALCGELAASSLSALKRRTRVTMGRCQGFYCTAKLNELTRGCFQVPVAEHNNSE